ncbi:hypothetical protein COCVIDRAFT_91007, partial [Bipolaris victoriae FI3]
LACSGMQALRRAGCELLLVDTYLLYVAKSFSNKRAKPLLSAQERSSANFRLGKDDGSKTMPCRKTCGEKEARHIEQVCRLHV